MLQLFKDKPIVTAGAIALLLAAAIYAVVANRGNRAAPPGWWYYNLDTGQFVVHNAMGQLPPVTLPGGGTGVLARRFACGNSCGDDLFTGYLEIYKDEEVQAPTGGPNLPGGRMKHFVAVEPPPGQTPLWIDATSPAGRSLRNAAGDRCGGTYRECLPQ